MPLLGLGNHRTSFNIPDSGSSTGTAPAVGGMFGAAQASKPLFGASTTTTAPQTGGLFGSSTATTGGGLFGSAATSQPAQPQTGGLFGATSQPQAGGLFGAGAGTTSQPQTGGLFGVSICKLLSIGYRALEVNLLALIPRWNEMLAA